MRTCTKCDISLNNDYRPIWGDGSSNAYIMFVSRQPESLDHKFNVPLLSRSGNLFQLYLQMFNFSRDEIYVTNAVKCKTPKNRYPTDSELYKCRDHLTEEINTVKPRIIVLMGITAIRTYFKLAFKDHQFHESKVINKVVIHEGKVIVLIHHPANALNDFNKRLSIFDGFKIILNLYRIAHPLHRTNIGI